MKNFKSEERNKSLLVQIHILYNNPFKDIFKLFKKNIFLNKYKSEMTFKTLNGVTLLQKSQMNCKKYMV